LSSFSTEPPAADVFEVSVFGPGKGECIVVHLGGRRWIVVDSCRDQRTKEVAALEYLRGIGVDLSTEVLAVVVTHAHDDHFDGIADIVEACDSAIVVTSQAVVNRDFLALLEAEHDIAGITDTASYEEFRRIFDIAQKRKNRATGMRPFKWATENRVLLTLPDVGSAPAATVTALSPSDQAITRALEVLSNNHLHAMGERSRRSKLNPNEASIALWVRAGGVNLLLGADLLSGPVGCGWRAVLESFAPPEPATLYKAAHHGSSTSHHDGLWSKLLVKNPVILLAPFRHGDVVVPKDSDIAYILAHTDKAWTTSPRPPTPGASFRKQKSQLGTLAHNPRDPYGKIGHLRARVPHAGGTWTVDNFAPAAPLAHP
jgi:beta-lactamase superfamily II metal-dependent hydrolase